MAVISVFWKIPDFCCMDVVFCRFQRVFHPSCVMKSPNFFLQTKSLYILVNIVLYMKYKNEIVNVIQVSSWATAHKNRVRKETYPVLFFVEIYTKKWLTRGENLRRSPLKENSSRRFRSEFCWESERGFVGKNTRDVSKCMAVCAKSRGWFYEKEKVRFAVLTTPLKSARCIAGTVCSPATAIP